MVAPVERASRPKHRSGRLVNTPAHYSLAESLLSAIRNGTFGVGDRLPSELQLCADHSLARGTVRQALGHLDKLGMIDRRPGSGTVVIATTPVADYQPLAQTGADIVALAAGTRLVDRESGEMILDEAGAERVGAEPGTAWFRLQGLRTLRTGPAVPLCWSEHYLRADLPREQFMTGETSLQLIGGHRLEQTISADSIDPKIAEQLDAPLDSPVLVITRRHYAPKQGTERLVAVGIHTHPADRYSITTVLA
jgi:GntR family transcriptional regulator